MNDLKKDLNKNLNAEEIVIKTDFIKLNQLLKYCGAAISGGQASEFIESGMVFLNDEVCTIRGKKVRKGDKVKISGETFEIK